MVTQLIFSFQIYLFNLIEFPTTKISQNSTSLKVAWLVIEDLSPQSKIAANQVFGSSYYSKIFCKFSLGASIAT
jgi:hypothetical protein